MLYYIRVRISLSSSHLIVNLIEIALYQKSSLRNLYLYNIEYFVQEHDISIYFGLSLTYFNNIL